MKEAAKKWNVSERSVRNYCADGKISGAVCQGKVWKIPEDAIKPLRKQRAGKVSKDLLTRLQMEKEAGISGGIYHKVQIELTYNSTSKPEDVPKEIKKLLKQYNQSKTKTLQEIIEFHYQFEKIHPFQDGNGRVGRLIMFKECLRNGITPFIIEDDIKEFYYRGLKEWKREPGYLLDTCLTAQDRFKVYMDYFGLE